MVCNEADGMTFPMPLVASSNGARDAQKKNTPIPAMMTPEENVRPAHLVAQNHRSGIADIVEDRWMESVGLQT